MWRMKSMMVLGVVAAVFVLGAVVAYGHWWWNSQIDVEGADVRTVWTVTDDTEDDYTTVITVALPPDAVAEIIEVASNEVVTLITDDDLHCRASTIDAQVTYVVTAGPTATGTEAEVWVTADGVELGRKTGGLGVAIHLDVDIPGTCSG